MNTTTESGNSLRLSLFSLLALSRTPHALLDLAAPALAALLCLGTFPPFHIVLIGLVTAFAGYTAVYALNDLVDYRVDQENIPLISPTPSGATEDLDSLFARHPLAQGLIGYRKAVVWTLFWTTLAIIGAWWLNPVCLAIFLLSAMLEALYCGLLKITWLRSGVSGLVKTAGPIAAVFAVNPSPSPVLLSVLFIWFFLWEIGGQNLPNDLADADTDRRLGAVTIPVRFGVGISVFIVFFTLALAVLFSIVLIYIAPPGPDPFMIIAFTIAGLYFLLLPARKLYLKPLPELASGLFNRASYYPLALLIVFSLRLLID